MTSLQPVSMVQPAVFVGRAVSVAAPRPDRYRSLVVEAAGRAEAGALAAERAYADGRTSLAALDPARLDLAMRQADDAMFQLGAAERYRRRSHAVIPGPVLERTAQAVQDLEMGTRALRRASVLLADPQVDTDPSARQATLSALGIGASHYRMADWLLDSATRIEPVPQA